MIPRGAVFAWLVIDAANLINVYEVGKDGEPPYQQLKGRKLTSNMIEFGVCMCISYPQASGHLQSRDRI